MICIHGTDIDEHCSLCTPTVRQQQRQPTVLVGLVNIAAERDALRAEVKQLKSALEASEEARREEQRAVIRTAEDGRTALLGIQAEVGALKAENARLDRERDTHECVDYESAYTQGYARREAETKRARAEGYAAGRAEALEEAARVADAEAERNESDSSTRVYISEIHAAETAETIAAAIRALGRERKHG
jgi:hypothetical protein